MGVSDASDGWIAGDGSCAGAIVWVRRRNGSWWPGRILGHDELPASHLMSPRSGTPVKLLGREDASVDWYNLEKSKRVKAFRCGEFDACIERVEASQGIPIKKREKYARREDAILHALELEKQQFEMKQQKPGISTNNINNKTLSSSKIELNNCSSEKYTRNSQPGGYNRFTNHKSPTLSGRVLFSPEEDNMGSSSYVHKGKSGKPFSREEDIPESIPRTRGLQDFGLRIAPSKKKHYQFVTWETLQKPADNRVGVLPFAGHSMGDTRRSGSSKNSFVVKRKSSQGNMLEDSPSKRRDRRRPLLQVLESSAKLPFSHPVQHDHDVGILPTQREKDHMATICHAKRNKSIHLPAYSNDILDHVGYSFKQIPTGMDDCHDSLADEKTSSGLIEAFDSDSSEKDYLESEMEKEGNLLRDMTQNLGQGSKDSNPPFPQMHPHDRTIDTCDEVGVSNWHMKGKRNIRRIDGSADKYNGPVEGTSYDGKGTRFKVGRMDPSGRSASAQGFYPKNEEFDYAYNEGDLVDRERRYPPSSKPMKDRGSGFMDSDDDSHLMGWGADGGPSHMARRIYREDSDGSDEMEAVLVDVDLKVQTSYQGERVPLVSLMSRLNGKAIIGHPVQVEMLEDGSSAGLIVSRNEPSLPESTAPAAVWKTARRTVVQRAPRSNLAPSALEADDSEPLNYSDFEGQPLLKKPQYSGYLSHQTRLAKTSAFHARGLASGKFQRKLPKRVSLSGQKTRMLSSLSAEQKHGGENLDAKLAAGGLGLIKPVEGAVPLITCVPVKVVFSRILESIGRPPSSAAHRVLVTGSETARDPS